MNPFQARADIMTQDAPAVVREGLPFWIFYFLVSLIVLLLLVIFLRDKDLRRRLSLGLDGAKRRVLRKRLQLRLDREKRRKKDLFRELGRTIWGGGIAPETFGPAFERLELLEAAAASRRAALRALQDGILAAGADLDQARKRRRRAPQDGEYSASSDIRGIRETERAIKRRIRDLERKSKAARAGLRESERDKAAACEHLGVQADSRRIARADLQALYDRIDGINRAILAALDKIEKLR